jgi:lipoprotein-releasing system ATP-binding protein
MEEIILEGKNIKKRIKEYEILKGVNIKVKKGEFLSIIGASGSGKSSLLYILGLIDKPTEGELFLENEKIDFNNESLLYKKRNEKLGFVFQFHYLINELTALENVMFPMLKGGKSLKEAKERALFLLEKLNIVKEKDKKPYEMSGGQQQRVAIARALSNNPSIILADEPTGNLDSKNTMLVMDIFLNLNKEGTTFVMVTHEPDLAKMTHRTIEMKDGIIINEIINSLNS